MLVTLTDLLMLVNDELENTIERGSSGAVGDGISTVFLVAPQARTVLDNDNFACYVDEVRDFTGVMDFSSGVFDFEDPPSPEAAVTFDFDHVYWSETLVTQAINAGINSVFPYFYNPTTEVMSNAPEYTFTTVGAEVVTMVATTGTTVAKIKRSKYTTYRSGDDLVLRWYGGAPSGTLRANIVCRPALVGGTLNVTDRANAPIISYATYSLLNQKQAARMRADTALATVGQGNLSPRQMNDASNSFFLQYQAQCQQGKQLPWSMS